ncbi:VWA domain-containing protein [Jeotgalibacillus sp. S-D1]|uniref:vWA domain-containing protein n=1 Tax=Jeotgalibacillus sp. S-D1 TaxID=2552189 RepID=UPI00105986BD|nr:VWA domain-containing protein [Jeotgalibacillus sp. S-D1]TDL34867.1 VWA domain-containing protein [Jeotgalibacillus sp. S-D1]
MQRFIQFNDENINSFKLMELIDLAKTLTKEKEMDVEYGPLNYLDLPNQKIIVSHFWDHRKDREEWLGLTSDIYLRAIGTFRFSNVKEINRYLKKVTGSRVSSFAKQLFMIIEDTRIEEEIKRLRPGTAQAFNMRRALYTKYFESQLKVHLVKGVHTDALFNFLYLLLNAQSPSSEWPDIHQDISRAEPFIRQQMQLAFDVRSTAQSAAISFEVVSVLEEIVKKDMLNEYFHLPEKTMEEWENNLTFNELKRKDPLVNEDEIEEKATGEEETFEEEFRTWHRESSDKGESFLQFDLDQGAKTNIKGDTAREGEDGDQALGMVQGKSKKTAQQQYDGGIEEVKQEEAVSGNSDAYGRENRFAHAVFKPASVVMPEDQRQYDRLKKEVGFYQKKLQKIIEKTLDHKKIQPRNRLVFGRLSKQLIPFFTEEQPKVFYKKNEKSPEIDATFTLLLDCSASMHDKMEETKKGLILFHEVLKSVRVPHEIVGFWEDTDQTSESYQPNYLKTVVEYDQSVYSTQSAAIMQLQPEEDNRDGFAIRHMTERLIKRKENKRFLLVFSDGEPAAMNYEQNGIMDTHEAVVEARKYGIEVMNVFLSKEEIPESQKEVIQNMYGKYSLFIPQIEELPDILFPLLKRLLYKSI